MTCQCRVADKVTDVGLTRDIRLETVNACRNESFHLLCQGHIPDEFMDRLPRVIVRDTAAW